MNILSSNYLDRYTQRVYDEIDCENINVNFYGMAADMTNGLILRMARYSWCRAMMHRK